MQLSDLSSGEQNKIIRGFPKTSVFGKATLDLYEKAGFRPLFRKLFPKLTEFWEKLIIQYELLFKAPPGSLVLIDEPETSMHVAWQLDFLQDIEKIAKISGLSFIIATHSPDIINAATPIDLYELIHGTADDLEDKTGNSILREDYCGVLQKSFQLNHFIQTRLYDNILSWQKTNGFDILEAASGAANA